MKNIWKYIWIFVFALGISVFSGDCVKAEEQIIQSLQATMDLPAVAGKYNGDGSDIESALQTVQYKGYTEDSGINLPIQWDLSGVNLQLVGAYTAYGIPIVPKGYTLAEGLTLPTFQVPVSVQMENRPEINVYYKLTAAGLFIFPWLPNDQADTWQIWLKMETGDWTNLTEIGYAMSDSSGLYLPARVMRMGATYYLMVKGEDFVTKTLKFQHNTSGQLDILGYYTGNVGGMTPPDMGISSYDPLDEDYVARCYAFALPTGSDMQRVIEVVSTRGIRYLSASTSEEYEDTTDNPRVDLPVKWDYSQVNVSVPGVYQITGTFELPEGYTLDEDLTLPTASVYLSVQNTGSPQLDTYYMPLNGIVGIPMNLEGFTEEEIRSFVVQMQINGGAFQDCLEDVVDINEWGIHIDLNVLTRGKRYGFHVQYPDGETKVFSFTYDDTYIIDVTLEGRNYADRTGNDLPDIYQESEVTPPAEITLTPVEENSDLSEEKNESGDEDNSQEDGAYYADYYSSYRVGSSGSSAGTSSSGNDTPSVSVTEISTAAQTLISGERLADLLEYSGGVLDFEKDGISLRLKEEVVKGWEIRPEEELQVMIQKTTEASIAVRIFAAGEEVFEIAGSHLLIPLAEMEDNLDIDALVITDAQGNELEYSYQEKQKILDVLIDKAGDFFLENRDAVSEAASGNDTEAEIEVLEVFEGTDADEVGMETEELTDAEAEEGVPVSEIPFYLIVIILFIILACVVVGVTRHRK